MRVRRQARQRERAEAEAGACREAAAAQAGRLEAALAAGEAGEAACRRHLDGLGQGCGRCWEALEAEQARAAARPAWSTAVVVAGERPWAGGVALGACFLRGRRCWRVRDRGWQGAWSLGAGRGLPTVCERPHMHSALPPDAGAARRRARGCSRPGSRRARRRRACWPQRRRPSTAGSKTGRCGLCRRARKRPAASPSARRDLTRPRRRAGDRAAVGGCQAGQRAAGGAGPAAATRARAGVQAGLRLLVLERRHARLCAHLQ